MDIWLSAQISLTVEAKFNELRDELVQNLRSRLDAMAEEVSACIKEDIRKETLEKLVNQKIKKNGGRTEMTEQYG